MEKWWLADGTIWRRFNMKEQGRRMPQLQRKDAIKFLGLLMGKCKQEDNGHSWHRCPRCLAFKEIEAHHPLAMKLLAAAVEALNDATPRTEFTADDLRNGTIKDYE